MKLNKQTFNYIRLFILFLTTLNLTLGFTQWNTFPEEQFLVETAPKNNNKKEATLHPINNNLSFSKLITDKVSVKSSQPLTKNKLNVTPKKPQRVDPFSPKDQSHFNITHFGIEQGNLSNFNYNVTVTSNKEVWVGTRGGGLFRLNGMTINTYTKENGFPSNSVTKIFEDKDKNLWFATTDNGLVYYDGFDFFQINEETGISSNHINAITQTSDGKIWIGTTKGINFIENDSLKKLSVLNEDNNLIVKDLLADSKGNLWIATWGEGLKFITPNYRMGSIDNQNGLPNNYLVSLGGFENIYFGTYGDGILAYDFKNLLQLESPLITKGFVARTIWQENKEDIWFGTDAGEIYKFSTTELFKINAKDGLSGKPISSISGDGKGTILFTSFGGGLSVFKENSFVNFFSTHGIGKGQISSIYEDSKGNIWLGSWGGGLIKLNHQEFKRFEKFDFLFNNIVTSIEETKDQEVWFSNFEGGLVSYKNGTFTKHPSDAYRARDMLAEKNRLLVTNYKGLFILSDGNTEFIQVPNEKESFGVNCIIEYQNNYLIGSAYGIYKSDSTLHQWESEYNFINSRVNHFKIVNDELLVATDNGLYKIKGNNYELYNKNIGLKSNKIIAFEVDQSGNIWVGTPAGLAKIVSPESSLKKVIHFDSKKGQRGVEFRTNAFLIDKNNHLWFSTENALTQYPLKETGYKSSSTKPRILFLSMSDRILSNKLTDNLDSKGITFKPPERFSYLPQQLSLPYNSNDITFYFSSTSIASAYNQTFHYKLEGHDQEWKKVKEEFKITYTNLSQGKYTFKLKAVDSEGTESETVTYAFVIHPPWWNTWIAWIAYAVILIFIIVLIVKWKTAKLKQKQILLQEKIDDATQEITLQRNEIQTQHNEIKDSIAYAKRIQDAILPSETLIQHHLPQSFILYRPKDLVAGDFYWFEETTDGIIIAAADCTGHGVPGAMVSVVCHNALNRSVREFDLNDTGKILNKTRDLVIETFVKSGQHVKDGMDISLVSIKKLVQSESQKFLEESESVCHHSALQYSGAYNPLWIIKNNEEVVVEVKANKQPIGRHTKMDDFTTHNLTLNTGDLIYLFSDGFADQFGGAKGKKYKTAKFKKFLLSIKDESMETQHELLNQEFNKWKGNLEQIDDVCVLGIRL